MASASPTALPALPFNPSRLRSYVLRLPFFTRVVVLAIVVFWILGLQSAWTVTDWGALTPDEIFPGGLYRLNTYPLIHTGLFHAFVNVLALAPLLETFEAEHGTLTSVALFTGPFSTFPAGLYIFFEKFILRRNTPVVGASVWVFLLLGIEAIRTYRANPYLLVGDIRVPTWTSPLFVSVLVFIFLPNTSFLGHLCALGVGYLFGLGYLKLLMPPERILRFVESKLNLLGRIPRYVSVDQKTYGRYGVLPSSANPGIAMSTYVGSSQRLGP